MIMNIREKETQRERERGMEGEIVWIDLLIGLVSLENIVAKERLDGLEVYI